MTLNLTQYKKAFIRTGNELEKVLNCTSPKALSEACKALYEEIQHSPHRNPWFTTRNVKMALAGIRSMLEPRVLDYWLNNYNVITPKNPKTVAVIMAGNIPFVGFHDFMCVLLSGHHFLGKLSSQDKELPVKIADLLIEAEPELQDKITFSDGILGSFDAVIATGSNNSSRYFEYYFGKYPHIIRKNRSSLAILSGMESQQELQSLADDVFMYFGMGCRNVSKILVPLGYDLTVLLDAFSNWNFLHNHHKFFNNYEYQKAVLLVNNIPHLDTGFSLLIKDERLTSPLSVLYYDEYKEPQELKEYLEVNREILQCVVIPDGIDFDFPARVSPGTSQRPAPWDYADGVDTMKFLLQL